MKRLSAILFAATIVLSAQAAFAQATRTWVSGVGDDANPCSRTAPCKTFAGAISKTATGGEISVLDPGGFGAVSITKAITIDGSGTHGSILSALTNGVIINAPSTATVVLRNLSINGVGTGLNGIRILSAKAVRIENVTIFGFTNRAVDIQNTVPVSVSIDRSSFRQNTGIGVAATTSSIDLTITESIIEGNNSHGVWVNGGRAVLARSSVQQNGIAGVAVTGGSSRVTLSSTVIALNNFGIQGGTGGGNATGAMIGLFDCVVSGNATGISIESATVESHGNNAIKRNTSDITGGALINIGMD
jgi:hypothetical protein